jgi:hypothetical protein
LFEKVSTCTVAKYEENGSKKSVRTTFCLVSLNGQVLVSRRTAQGATESEGVVVASDVEVSKVLGRSRCPDFEWTRPTSEAGSAQRMFKDLRKQKEMICESYRPTSTFRRRLITQISAIFGEGVGGEVSG